MSEWDLVPFVRVTRSVASSVDGALAESLDLITDWIVFLLQLADELPDIFVHVGSDLSITTTSKRSSNSWTFTITSKVRILLQQIPLYSYHKNVWSWKQPNPLCALEN